MITNIPVQLGLEQRFIHETIVVSIFFLLVEAKILLGHRGI